MTHAFNLIGLLALAVVLGLLSWPIWEPTPVDPPAAVRDSARYRHVEALLDEMDEHIERIETFGAPHPQVQDAAMPQKEQP